MPRFFLAGAAVVLAVLVGAIALQPRSVPNVAGSPMQSGRSAALPPPSGSAAPASAEPVPDALRHRWMGEPNGLAAATGGSWVSITGGSLASGESNHNDRPLLTADVAVRAGLLEVTSAGSVPTCDPGATGTYRYELSPGGHILAVSVVTEACAVRSKALAGTWWASACRDPNDNCLGELEAGTYRSQFINFAQPGGPGWVADFGAVTYTVPEGWANNADWPAHLALSPKDSYAKWTQSGGTDRGIDVFADVHASLNTKRPCSGTPVPSAGSDPSRIVDDVRGIKGLVATAPTPVTIDGRTGVQVDLSVDDATLVPCGSDRVVEYLISAGEGVAVAPGERTRLIVLPDGDRAIAVDIVAPAAVFDELIGEAMPIVESMQFR